MIPKVDKGEEKKNKRKKVVRIETDICPNCGDKYCDILGIGKCGKCFDKIKKRYQ